ncbi:MAG: nucleotidyltransferase domain-containing protein [Planctomycetes bacterium]|nr:nucleotidyltransferase domain-containing protein [Planctomycetota bacterium]
MKTLSADLLDALVKRLVAEFHPEQIWLFGSHAWGTPREDSDLDILVVVPQSDEAPVRRAQRAHLCLSGLGVAKDVLVRTRAEVERFRHVPASIEAEIFARGRCLYG